MDTINFRVWSDTDADMLDWNTLKQTAYNRGENQLLYFVLVNKPEGYSIMQFTGLYDINKNPIYEDDIVFSRKYGNRKWVIKYRTDLEYCGFLPVEINTDKPSLFISWFDMEVVGNIHQNPELLKPTSESNTLPK